MPLRHRTSEVDQVRRPLLSLRLRVDDVLVRWHPEHRGGEEDGRKGFLPDPTFKVGGGGGEVEVRGEDVHAEVEAFLEA